MGSRGAGEGVGGHADLVGGEHPGVVQHLAAAQPKLVRSLALFGPLAAPTDAARTGVRALPMQEAVYENQSEAV